MTPLALLFLTGSHSRISSRLVILSAIRPLRRDYQTQAEYLRTVRCLGILISS